MLHSTYPYTLEQTTNLCVHCGGWHAGPCSRIKAVEYYEDGRVKRVEYYDDNAREVVDLDLVRAINPNIPHA